MALVDIPGTSNNAPPPIPGGYGNPTGANIGVVPAIKTSGVAPSGGGGQPLFPAYGPIGPSPTQPPAYNAPTYGGTSLQGLSSGLPGVKGNAGSIRNELVRAYGPGVGNLLFSVLNKGLFNPQVAAAFLNAQQPGITRGEATIEGAFGDAGARFSSAAALGIGDYQSTVQLNQQQVLASLFETAQNQELSLLTNTLSTLHTEEASSHSSIFGDIVGGLEIAGGIASEVFAPGNPAGIGAITGGIGTLGGGGGGSSGGGSPTGGSSQTIAALLKQLIASGQAKSTVTNVGGVNDPNAPGQSGGGIGSTGTIPDPIADLQPTIDASSAGATLGGTDPYGTANQDTSSGITLEQLLQMISSDPGLSGLNMPGGL